MELDASPSWCGTFISEWELKNRRSIFQALRAHNTTPTSPQRDDTEDSARKRNIHIMSHTIRRRRRRRQCAFGHYTTDIHMWHIRPHSQRP